MVVTQLQFLFEGRTKDSVKQALSGEGALIWVEVVSQLPDDVFFRKGLIQNRKSTLSQLVAKLESLVYWSYLS